MTEPLSEIHSENIVTLRERLGVKKSFDCLERHLTVAGADVAFFYVDGFVKDGEMQRVMQTLLSLKEISTAGELEKRRPYVEIEVCRDRNKLVRCVLSGQSAILSETFGAEAILFDLRTYPARSTEEPESDKVMQGAHDGFVETLVVNTALIRRRIRDERLRMEHFSIGECSATDVVVCYMEGSADKETLHRVKERLSAIKPRALTLGFQSLAESMIKRGWLNPFPKIRTTERPDTAAAQLLGGSVIVLCDTSPQVMIFPTSIFDYLEETDDFYFPPLTGTYLRLVRGAMLLLSVFVTPLWYLAVEYGHTLPASLAFLVPDNVGALPIVLQLFLAEIAIDGLKIASMNTPSILSSSLSIVGGLILGDFAVDVGWLCPDVILYMAFVAIANFAGQNYELGYAFKFSRMIILTLVYFLGVYGLILGVIVFCAMIVTNKTLGGGRRYLYPLIPFNARDFLRLIVRQRKQDFDE